MNQHLDGYEGLQAEADRLDRPGLELLDLHMVQLHKNHLVEVLDRCVLVPAVDSLVRLYAFFVSFSVLQLCQIQNTKKELILDYLVVKRSDFLEALFLF